jgi:hypothetical protein
MQIQIKTLPMPKRYRSSKMHNVKNQTKKSPAIPLSNVLPELVSLKLNKVQCFHIVKEYNYTNQLLNIYTRFVGREVGRIGFLLFPSFLIKKLIG